MKLYEAYKFLNQLFFKLKGGLIWRKRNSINLTNEVGAPIADNEMPSPPVPAVL